MLMITIKQGNSPLQSKNKEDACDGCPVRHSSFCEVLDKSEMDKLSQITHSVNFKAGHLIVSEEQDANYLYNIVNGMVELYKLLPDGRRQITGFLHQGDLLGLLVGEEYPYHAVALTDVELCCVPKDSANKLFQDFEKIEGYLLKKASHELAEAQERMLLLGRKTAEERLATFLIAQLKRQNKDEKANEIHLPMMRSDIADYLGLTTETVSRVFSKLKKERLVEIPSSEKSNIIVLDIKRLKDVSEGLS